MAYTWTVASVAKEFSLSPTAAARELEEDPSRLAVTCLEFLTYARAKADFEAAKDANDLKGWKDSEAMAAVWENKRLDRDEARAARGY